MQDNQQDPAPQLTLTVNGRRMSVSARCLDELLRALAMDDAAVVAELNGAIRAKEEFSRTPLRDGDQVELVRFVGGG